MLANPTLPTPAEIMQARELTDSLDRVEDGRIRVTLSSGVDETTQEVPLAVIPLLRRILNELAQGNAVTVMPIHAQLTTQRAADLLGVSRPFIVKQIDEGRLPAQRVGSHRRIRFSDLMAYKRVLEAERDRALEELAAFDEEFGL